MGFLNRFYFLSGKKLKFVTCPNAIKSGERGTLGDLEDLLQSLEQDHRHCLLAVSSGRAADARVGVVEQLSSIA